VDIGGNLLRDVFEVECCSGEWIVSSGEYWMVYVLVVVCWFVEVYLVLYCDVFDLVVFDDDEWDELVYVYFDLLRWFDCYYLVFDGESLLWLFYIVAWY